MGEIRSLCVYCGSSSRVDEIYQQAAHAMGTAIAERGMQLVYGGGRVGLMGIAADAALAAGGRVVGIIPEHLQSKEVGHQTLSELLVVDSMHTRKRMMVERSDAFIVLPGGLGTLDEAFEILTWRQLRLHDKPVVVLNTRGYWDPLLKLVEHLIDSGFARPEHRDLYTVVSEVEEVFAELARAPAPTVDPKEKWL
ncbi:LOG family protein [Arenibaculum pallidiluteum]|uniref:LOG family protein n=1 Tax=Arenibaculum pallidiluteum TaxID=2812559 RepID=UPI001A97C3CC|nr:TIGR00730 family Rossman fold protein [Arenibaculum pallidiluteum]